MLLPILALNGSILLHILLLLLSLFLILQFLEIQQEKLLHQKMEVVAPADGKVVVIEEVEETEYFKDKRIQKQFYVTHCIVHVSYYPINGKVQYAKYHHPVKYLVAWHPKSSTENERTTVVVENDKIAVLFSK